MRSPSIPIVVLATVVMLVPAFVLAVVVAVAFVIIVIAVLVPALVFAVVVVLRAGRGSRREGEYERSKGQQCRELFHGLISKDSNSGIRHSQCPAAPRSCQGLVLQPV